MYSCGNSRVVKKARSRDRARFLPSVLIPFRIVFIIGGNIEESMVRFFNGIRCSGCRGVGVLVIGVFSRCQSRAWSNSSFASPSSELGMKGFICVIFSGSASVGLKFSIWSFVIGIEANAVFSWRE